MPGLVFVERSFLVHDHRKAVDIPVSLLCHAPVARGRDFTCTYAVNVDGQQRRSMAVFGVDGIQALLLAIGTLAVDAIAVFRLMDVTWPSDEVEDLMAVSDALAGREPGPA